MTALKLAAYSVVHWVSLLGVKWVAWMDVLMAVQSVAHWDDYWAALTAAYSVVH